MQEDRNAANGTAATAATAERRSVLQNALATIERLQARLEAAESASHEPIAIVGMACRVPGGAEDPDAFWQLLAEGKDVVGEVPPDRWDVDAYYDPDPAKLGKARTKAGGFLKDLERFEPSFFGMSPREATGVDPQQRLLLEVAWEALEHAGVPADQLDGSLTGVFVGITSMDYSQRIDVSDPARSDIYLATGTALNAAAGRVSFTFGFRGPCMAIDTACSSSLVAIHTACQSLRNGESDLVLAGGVNCILSPDPFVLISKWGMLSPDGRCKTFDASANGFVRGEGCGLIVLERLSDAVAKGRRILAVIPGSAINQDGRSSGLTVPNGLAQQEVVRQALAAARLKPLDVSYVEAHGTGTSLGDPIEVEALAAVYGEGRAMARPFEVGSVKSNIGHLEAASGVASVIKIVMALQHRQLPASLHVKQLTPAIPWESIPVRVSTELHPWQPDSGRRIAGISAFGFSGMNAHVLIAEAPPATALTAVPPPSRPLHALPLSARSDAALAELAGRFADHLSARPQDALADVCATAAIGRSHLPLRSLIVAPDRDAMIAQLRELAGGQGTMARGTASASGRTRVAFLFTGQGAQYPGMGRELDAGEPVFRATLDRCAAVLDPLLGRPLRELMFDAGDGSLDQTGFTQPALYALEVSLAALWRSWGVEPSVVVGHSVGEFAAAAVAGVFSIEDGARLIAARGRLMQALPAGGVMVSVQGDPALVQREVAACPDKVSVAAYNAPGNVVIAGAKADVEAIAGRLAAQGLRTQALQVSHAFHSPLMAPMLDEFRRVAAGVTYSAPVLNWISNLTGETLDWAQWGSRMADYWTQHVREPVNFEKGMASLAAAACDAHVEVGPHPTLIGLGTQCLSADRPVEWVPSLKRTRPAWEQVLDSVARLYVRGARIDWLAFHGDAPRHSLELPTYPFQRQPYIISFAPKSSRPAGEIVHELLGERLEVAGVAAQFEQRVDRARPAWLQDHRVAGEAVMPMTAYLEACLSAARAHGGEAINTIENIEVAEAMTLREGEERVMQVSVDQGGVDAPSRVRVFSRSSAREGSVWSLHASATVLATATLAPEVTSPLAMLIDGLPQDLDVQGFYQRMQDRGIEFGPSFRCMKRLRCGVGEAIGEIVVDDGVLADAGSYLVHPALLDACFHVSGGATDSLAGDDGRMYLPVGVESYRRWRRPAGTLYSRVKIRPPAVLGELIEFDIHVETSAGEPVVQLGGLRARRASRELFQQQVDAKVGDWLYEVAWRPRSLAAPTEVRREGVWLVFDDGTGRGERLADELVQRGGKVQRVVPHDEPAAGTVGLQAEQGEDYARLLEATGTLAGVVSLWPLRVPALTPDDLPSAGQRFGTDAALMLLQALSSNAAAAGAPRVWFVTAGSQVVDGTETLRIQQAPVAGLARVAASEHPDLRVTLVDLDPQAPPSDARWLVDEVLADAEETQVAWRKGVRWTAHLARKARRSEPHVDDAPVRLNISERGTLENLAIEPSQRRAPGPGQVEIRVRASGLNFRDVLSALGMYPGEIRHLGSDCAGEIIAVGEGVTQFAVGDRVVAMVEGAFASHALTRWEFVAPLPQGLDFEQGAAIPTAYLTADITLNLLGGMKRGDKVLIHSGAGGVGMAAIALAHRVGAEVFATAGSPEKRAVLARLGVHHVLDTRSTAFCDEILRITDGRGVDMVLNSLAGAMLDKSFECLADGGIFLEIGKRGLWTHERVQQLGRGIRYHIVDCNDNARETPELVGQIFTRVLKEIESGVLPWLPCTTFPFDKAADAFRYMAQARHIGRVVFRHRVEPRRLEQPVRPDATYLVTGGLKGLGLLAAQWLAGEGARYLLLAGRSAPDEAATKALADLLSDGVHAVVVQADIGAADGVQRVMDALGDGLPPLGGVIHCAAVLDDGVLARQSVERFARVMAPKADGAWRLHAAFDRHGHRPDFFVFYSSLSAVFGSPGQGNYVAANAFLDALAHHRRGHDLAATSINWGAWAEVGMATRGNTVSRAGAQGLASLSPKEGMQALGVILREEIPQVSVAPIDWVQLGAQFGAEPVPPLLRDLVAQSRQRSGAESRRGSARGQRVDYSKLDGPQRLQQITAMVRRELATVLALSGSADSIAADAAFSSLGLDSLTAVELRNRLQADIGRPLPPTAAFDWPTIEEMSRQLAGLIGRDENATGALVSIPRVPRDHPLPASLMQERLWLFDQLEPDSTTYLIEVAWQLRGELDASALQRAAAFLTSRHESLRTCFESVDGELLQIVEAEASPPVQFVNCEDGETDEQAALARLRTEAQKPFNLRQAPLWRIVVLSQGTNRHWLALTLHHTVADGWSTELLARELATLYAGFREGRASALAALPIQYADYAAWQRRLIAEGALDASLAYWRTKLAGAPPALELPLDRPRPALQRFEGALSTRQLRSELRHSLHTLARSENVTLFMVMLAAFNAVLARHAGQDDLCVGLPVAGRDREELKGLVGVFIQTVVLRTRIAPDMSFSTLLRQVRESFHEAYAHQSVPFDKLVAELGAARDPSRTPLFQVMVNMHNFGSSEPVHFAGLEAEAIQTSELGAVQSKFDLTLYLRDDPDSVALTLVYNATLFNADRIDDLLSQYVQLLSAVAKAPERPMVEISLVTDRAAGLLPDLQHRLGAVRLDPVHAGIGRHAMEEPQRLAVIDSHGALTFAELELRSNQLARFLADAGIGRGDVVAILAARHAGLPWAMLGVLKAGAAFMILDPAQPAQRSAQSLRLVRPTGWVRLDGGAPLPSVLDDALRELPIVAFAAWQAADAAGGAAWHQCSDRPLRREVDVDDLAYVAFSSGSTGEPKAIAGNHRPLSHFFDWHGRQSAIGPGDRFSVLSGLGHDPLLRDVLGALWLGATCCLPETARMGDPGYLGSWMAQQGITVCHLTPAMAELVATREPAAAPPALPALRRVFFGGELLRAGTVATVRRMAPSAMLVNFYGATETPQAMGWHVVPQSIGTDSLPMALGRGIDGVQLLVLNGQGQLAGIGELGEIHIRTPYLSRGYLNDAAGTAQRFVAAPGASDARDRMYRTGDLGRYRPDGEVEFVGRLDGQVKLRGYRIETGEIEAALRRQPEVGDAAVLLHEEVEREPRLVAFIVLRDGRSGRPVPEWRERLRQLLPDYMLPAQFVVLDHLPMTPNGKLDRRALPLPSTLYGRPRVAPSGPTQTAIAAIWAEVLGESSFGADDDFFALGGHSLMATRVLARLRARLGIELSLRTFFEAPTVAGLARTVDDAAGRTEGIIEREDISI